MGLDDQGYVFIKMCEICHLSKMLCDVLEEIQYQDPGIVLDDEVMDWYLKYKEAIAR